jgi:hypothetical protein
MHALSSRYNLRKGEFPSLPWPPEVAAAWWGRSPFATPQENAVESVSPNLLTASKPTGHNTAQDTSILDGLRVNREVPLSPLFVRDLAGRTVYLGPGPELKSLDEWSAYLPQPNEAGQIDGAALNPFVPFCTFPRFSACPSRMSGLNWVEQVFLTHTRCLEESFGHFVALSGSTEDDENLAIRYEGPNLYPYKLRLDTFYIDGYKLPQTNMLYARTLADGANPASARNAGQELLEKWRTREPGQDYPTWLAANVTAHESERLYNLGCTLIPTFDACNGYAVISADFEVTDYWPGRAVGGLHDVVEERTSNAPYGTILQVLSPGFITANHVHMAQVVISNGEGYVSPHSSNPAPLLPNLHLPHQRTVAQWGATWLPTHPQHFEAPAIWGFDPANSGRFLQLSGPLWDPLHYTYASTPIVLECLNQATSWPVMVPEEMTNRCYPIVAPTHFDTLHSPIFQQRLSNGGHLLSSLTAVPTTGPTANIGYHPLPAEFEFELDPFWFPQLHPLNREHGECPAEFMPQLAPVITPAVSVGLYVSSVVAPQAPWLSSPENMAEPSTNPIENYPQLSRYLLAELPLEDVLRIAPTPFLGNADDYLSRNVPTWWRSEEGEQLDTPATLATLGLTPAVTEALWQQRLFGADLLRLRHLVYQTQLPLYVLTWWSGGTMAQLEELYVSTQPELAQEINADQTNPALTVAEQAEQRALAERQAKLDAIRMPGGIAPTMAEETADS